jgi:hypothetical protein
MARVVAGAQVAAEKRAIEIDQDVVILTVFGIIEHDAFEDGGDGSGFDAQPGFFPDFADDGVFQALPGFDQAAGKRPFARERGPATFYEEDALAVENEGSDSQEGPGWIAAGHLI